MRLSGKNILVVGVGPGLGTATAYMLLKDGANVAAVARKEEHLEKVKETLSEPANLLCIAADASSMEGAQKITKAVAEKFDGVDGIALLAGSYAKSPMGSMTEDTVDAMVSANLKAPLYVLNSILPLLKGNSSVVMVSSVFGTYKISSGNVAYAAVKAGVAKATESLAHELVGKGIRVNAVAPNSMDPGFEPGREWRSRRKLGDPTCPPEDVASVIAWLMTEEASWVSGAVIPVDGGAKK